jgi:hypothetical protein
VQDASITQSSWRIADNANTDGQLAFTQPPARRADNPGMSYETWLLDTTLMTFHRTCATLAEPRVDDIPRALRVMTPLADALEGFALGCAIAHVATAVRRWSGEAAGREVLRRMRRHACSAARPEPDEVAATLPAELAARMHRRLVHMPVAAFVATAGDAVSPIATHDDILELRLAAEIETGWEHYRAALAGTLLPTDSPLWSAWGKKLRGDKDVGPRDHILFVA